jgi:cation transport ATPase
VALPLTGPLLLGTGTFVIASIYSARPENWVGAALAIVILCITAVLIFQWSRQPEWNLKHEFALVAGALLTYAWLGFVLTSLVRPDDTVAWVGNVFFAMIAILLLIVTGKAVERQVNQPTLKSF